MKNIFTSASDKKDGFILTHPHQFIIYLPKSATGWTMNGETFKTAESWLDGATRKLLLLGITDVQYLSVPPDRSKKEDSKFHFYFSNEFQRYQFEAAILPNVKGLFKRTMTAPTPENSLEQQSNIRRFRAATDIDMSIFRTSPTSIAITTINSHDDIIIAMHLAQKSFDMDLENTASANNKIARLLTYSKKTEMNAPKNTP